MENLSPSCRLLHKITTSLSVETKRHPIPAIPSLKAYRRSISWSGDEMRTWKDPYTFLSWIAQSHLWASKMRLRYSAQKCVGALPSPHLISRPWYVRRYRWWTPIHQQPYGYYCITGVNYRWGEIWNRESCTCTISCNWLWLIIQSVRSPPHADQRWKKVVLMYRGDNILWLNEIHAIA